MSTYSSTMPINLVYPSHWYNWYHKIKTMATFHHIWQYIDPDGTTDPPPVPTPPPRPHALDRLSHRTAFERAAAKVDYLIQREEYRTGRQDARHRDKSMQKICQHILTTLPEHHHHYIRNLTSIREMLRTLRREFTPSLYVLNMQQAALSQMNHRDPSNYPWALHIWSEAWLSVMADRAEAGIIEAANDQTMDQFVRTLGESYPEFAESLRIHMRDYPELGSGASLAGVLRAFREIWTAAYY